MSKKKEFTPQRVYLSDETPEQLATKCFRAVSGAGFEKEAKEMDSLSQVYLQGKQYKELFAHLEKYCLIYGKLKALQQ